MTSEQQSKDKSKTVRGTYNLTLEALERDKHTLLRYEEAMEKCRNCGGNCWQPEYARGMMPIIRIENDCVTEAITICNYEQQRREQAKLNRLFQSARVPRLYEKDSFADYDVTPDNREAFRAANWIVGDDSGQGLFIYGPRGTGKTMLASIIANERVKKGKPVLFSSVPDLMGDIRATFHKGNTEETLQSVKSAAFLILDDLGAERMTEWVGEQLFTIINYRYNEKLPTVITSNYDTEEIVGRMAIVDRDGKVIDDMQGKRVMSRIFGMCQAVYVGGEDYRARGATA